MKKRVSPEISLIDFCYLIGQLVFQGRTKTTVTELGRQKCRPIQQLITKSSNASISDLFSNDKADYTSDVLNSS